MDLGTVLGILIGFGAILIGNALEGGHLMALIQPTALLIVLGGTIGATMVGFPIKVFFRACRAMTQVVSDRPRDQAKIVDEIVELATRARRDGIISIESAARNASDPFLMRALMMAIDGADSKTMRDNLELMITHIEEDKERIPRVWEAAGGYAPTIGIIGAVMGLIHVMQNLSDVGAVGSGIAVAFVATIYGVALANLLFIPAAGKLKIKVKAEITLLELMMEGALAIQEGQNPTLVREKLQSFHHEERERDKKQEIAAAVVRV